MTGPNPAPISEAELAAIEDQQKRATRGYIFDCALDELANRDVPRLVDEVRRLRAELAATKEPTSAEVMESVRRYRAEQL